MKCKVCTQEIIVDSGTGIGTCSGCGKKYKINTVVKPKVCKVCQTNLEDKGAYWECPNCGKKYIFASKKTEEQKQSNPIVNAFVQDKNEGTTEGQKTNSLDTYLASFVTKMENSDSQNISEAMHNADDMDVDIPPQVNMQSSSVDEDDGNIDLSAEVDNLFSDNDSSSNAVAQQSSDFAQDNVAQDVVQDQLSTSEDVIAPSNFDENILEDDYVPNESNADYSSFELDGEILDDEVLDAGNSNFDLDDNVETIDEKGNLVGVNTSFEDILDDDELDDNIVKDDKIDNESPESLGGMLGHDPYDYKNAAAIHTTTDRVNSNELALSGDDLVESMLVECDNGTSSQSDQQTCVVEQTVYSESVYGTNAINDDNPSVQTLSNMGSQNQSDAKSSVVSRILSILFAVISLGLGVLLFVYEILGHYLNITFPQFEDIINLIKVFFDVALAIPFILLIFKHISAKKVGSILIALSALVSFAIHMVDLFNIDLPFSLDDTWLSYIIMGIRLVGAFLMLLLPCKTEVESSAKKISISLFVFAIVDFAFYAFSVLSGQIFDLQVFLYDYLFIIKHINVLTFAIMGFIASLLIGAKQCKK